MRRNLLIAGLGLLGRACRIFGQEALFGEENFLSPQITYTTILTQQSKFIAEARVPDTSLVNTYNLWARSQQEDSIFLPHQQIRADLDRLRNIQYVGKAMYSSSNPQLYARLDNLTNISPYRAFPYTFGQLLIPQATSDTVTSDEYKHTTRQNSAFLGQKGIYFLCDQSKIDNISALSSENFLAAIGSKDAARHALQKPCYDYHLPHYLAFVYFHYLDDLQQSSNYYRIAAFDATAPTITTPALPAAWERRQRMARLTWACLAPAQAA